MISLTCQISKNYVKGSIKVLWNSKFYMKFESWWIFMSWYSTWSCPFFRYSEAGWRVSKFIQFLYLDYWYTNTCKWGFKLHLYWWFYLNFVIPSIRTWWVWLRWLQRLNIFIFRQLFSIASYGQWCSSTPVSSIVFKIWGLGLSFRWRKFWWKLFNILGCSRVF